MDDSIASQHGVSISASLPVTLDLQGSLARGTTARVSSEGFSFFTTLPLEEGRRLSVQFCFANDFAYMRLSGLVVRVREVGGSEPDQRLADVRFVNLNEPERSILESCVEAFRVEADPEERRAFTGLGSRLESSPRAIISLFVTDNPYLLTYRRRTSLSSTPSLPEVSAQRAMAADRRSGGIRRLAPPPLSWRLLWQSVCLTLQLVRDAMIPFLPRPVVRLLAPTIQFAFIAHPRDLTDIPRKFPCAHFFSPRLTELWFRHQRPFIASYITGLRGHTGEPLTGAMLISPPTTEQMIRDPRLARKRVCQTARLAERLGARIAGLGAFTSIVTRDGQDLDGKVRVGITTGNAHSAAIAVQNVLMAAALTNLHIPGATAAVVGGAGSVGSACARLLSGLVRKLILVDIKKDELMRVVAALREGRSEVVGGAQVELVQEADIIIAATSSPRALITASHLKPGAIVVDAAQPKNVSESIPIQRDDVLVVESAIVRTPGVDCHFDLGLGPGEALGCLSESMILTAVGWQGHYSLGKATPQQAAEIIKIGRALGFGLAYFRNSRGYITEEDLQRVTEARRTASVCV